MDTRSFNKIIEKSLKEKIREQKIKIKKFLFTTFRRKQYRRYKLNNILSFTLSLINKSKKEDINKNIFTIVKMLSDQITNSNTLSVLEELETRTGNNQVYRFDYLLTSKLSGGELSRALNKPFYKVIYKKAEYMGDIKINLSVDPIITTVWSNEKLSKDITDIGTKENLWNEEIGDQVIHLFLPMGLSIVSNGCHSTTVGMLKGGSEITINEQSRHNVYDVSDLYDIICFDGTYYRSEKYKIGENKIKLFKANNFEFGCIFEIGRLIKEHSIVFKQK